MDTLWLRKKPYEIRYLFHITHWRNVHSIRKFGLLSHNRAHAEGHVEVDISLSDVNEKRAWKIVQVSDRPQGHLASGRTLHDYVPLFFTPKTPMLYRRKEMQDKIVILALDASLLLGGITVFTDGNAASCPTTFFNDLTSIDRLDWRCIRSKGKSQWLETEEFKEWKRKRSAEVLVPSHVPFERVKRIAVRSEVAKQRLPDDLPIKIEVRPRWYFDD